MMAFGVLQDVYVHGGIGCRHSAVVYYCTAGTATYIGHNGMGCILWCDDMKTEHDGIGSMPQW